MTSEFPRIALKPRRARPFFSRHPWVFAGAIDRIEGNTAVGLPGKLVSDKGEFIAWGLLNPQSAIRLRLYSWDESRPLDRPFWSELLDRAIDLPYRRRILQQSDGACRLVFSEADGISGLTVDRYASWLVVQFTSKALYERKDLFLDLLNDKLQPDGIWLRTEKGIGVAEGLPLEDQLVAGREPPRPLHIQDGNLKYLVDLIEGQKTGMYLDQRANRQAVAAYAPDTRVLDVFCNTGGFGIAAAMNGARSVLGVDSSAAAITTANQNAAENGVSTRTNWERADAFECLERLKSAGEKFDVIIVDPPKMVRHRAGIDSALRGYYSLNRLAVDVLTSGGILATCSCSGMISRDDFLEMLAQVAATSGRQMQILEARGPAPDHPFNPNCPETEYLKCFICRVL